MRFLIFISLIVFITSLVSSCTDEKQQAKAEEKHNAIESVLISDSVSQPSTFIVEQIEKIKKSLLLPKPILLLETQDATLLKAQQLAISDARFCENLFDKNTHQAFRNEIFNVYPARPQEIPAANQGAQIFKVELFNYAITLTTTAFVDLTNNKVLSVTTIPKSQPDIPSYLKEIAIKIAAHNPEVIKALDYQPNEIEALMSNTKTSLNNTKCERSMHLCVAPTFIKDDKALWVIVDLTDFKVVGIRWTQTGTTGPVKRISERKLKADKIMECYCKKVSALEKQHWKLNYVITTSDGLRISEVYYDGKLVINNAKVVDWHVSYSNTDGFGYSDAVGCPEFSQAAVVAVSEPRVSDILDNGVTVGFALEQNFSSEQWPLPCNYNYLQRFEFYNDGRFRPIAASLGRGCGNNGTYRPVTRISFAGDQNTLHEWSANTWLAWSKEQWKLQNAQTVYTPEGYQYKLQAKDGSGYFIEPSQGQFGDGGRGDNAYLFVTKQHVEKDEGEHDLVTIGPCCNTDYKQGPEKFIDATPESITNTSIVLWYIAQMKNDDTKGREYCWAESYLENGSYKTKVYPCMSGPMFVPIKK